MTKKSITMQFDVPAEFYPTGEFRLPDPDKDEWFIDETGRIVRSEEARFHDEIGPRVILSQTSTALPTFDGPGQWPALVWAAKTAAGLVFCSTERPQLIEGVDGFYSYAPVADAVVLYPGKDFTWNIPQEITLAAPRDSLSRLTHQCAWTRCRDRKDEAWEDCVGDKWDSVLNFCPGCGRKAVWGDDR